MMRLFKNKRGLDYATFLTLAMLVIVVYLFVALSAKVEPFQVQIGEYQTAVLNAYQEGENALLYVDQAAKFSARDALGTVAQAGGIAGKPCAVLLEQGKTVNAWSAPNMTLDTCIAFVQPYDAFSSAFNARMNAFLAAYNSTMLPKDNYELFIRNDTLTGTAVKPALVWVRPPPGAVTAALGPIPLKTLKLVKVQIGEYDFWPSFTVPVQAKLEVYDELNQSVARFYQCTNTKSADECLRDFTAQTGATAERSVSDSAYVIVKKQNPVKNPYDKKELPPITFALYVG